MQEEIQKSEDAGDDENIKSLNFVWDNITSAQSRTGAFSMEDCEQVLNAYNLLSSFLKALNLQYSAKAK